MHTSTYAFVSFILYIFGPLSHLTTREGCTLAGTCISARMSISRQTNYVGRSEKKVKFEKFNARLSQMAAVLRAREEEAKTLLAIRNDGRGKRVLIVSLYYVHDRHRLRRSCCRR